MEHPLQNPSLTPVGLVFPISKARLSFEPPHGSINGDRVSAEFWARKNCLKSSWPLPAETILHEVLPTLEEGAALQQFDFEFRGRLYATRDIMILSTFMQWFGSNVGNSFLFEMPYGFTPSDSAMVFVEKLAREMKQCDHTYRLLHECNDICGTATAHSMISLVGGHHGPGSTYVSKHDRLVVRALMLWLATADGKKYVSEHCAYRDRALQAAQDERRAAVA
jgi:hypothetical protein